VARLEGRSTAPKIESMIDPHLRRDTTTAA
jgi:hypothetical protein